MVLVGEFPVYLAADGRVGIEGQIFLKIYNIVLAGGMNVSRGIRKVPACVKTDLVRIKLIAVRSM
jgi:hypothetical protein